MSGRIIRHGGRPDPAGIAFGLLACVAISVLAGTIGTLQSVRLLVAETDWGRLPGAIWAMRSQPVVWMPFLGWFGFALLLSMATLGALVLGLARRRGDSRWKQVGAVRRAKLHDEEAAMLLDRITRTLRRLGGAEPAPRSTGSVGSTAGVIPNLLTWAGSVVVLDVDQDNWDRTAGFRSKHLRQRTLLFNPLDSAGHSCRYNPLGHIDRRDAVAVIDELQRIATILLASPRTGSRAWTERARTAFLGVAAYLAATVDDGEDALPFTLGEVYRQFTAGDAQHRFPAILRQRERAGTPLSDACASALRDWCNASDSQFAAVRQTVVAEIGLWLNPYVDAATAQSDIDLRTLRDTRTSLYLGVAAEDLTRVAPVYNLLCHQLVDLNVRALPAGDQRRVPLLVVLDDAARIGRAAAIVDRDLAAYGVRFASSGRGRPASDSRPADAPLRVRSGAFGTPNPGIGFTPETDPDGALLLQQTLRAPRDERATALPLKPPHMLAIRPDPAAAARSLRVIARAETGETACTMAAPPVTIEEGLNRDAMAAARAAPADERLAALFEHIVLLTDAA